MLFTENNTSLTSCQNAADNEPLERSKRQGRDNTDTAASIAGFKKWKDARVRRWEEEIRRTSMFSAGCFCWTS